MQNNEITSVNLGNNKFITLLSGYKVFLWNIWESFLYNLHSVTILSVIYIFKAFLSFCEGQLKILKTLCPYIHYNISSVGRKEEEGI